VAAAANSTTARARETVDRIDDLLDSEPIGKTGGIMVDLAQTRDDGPRIGLPSRA
jgi:hypothetical protein